MGEDRREPKALNRCGYPFQSSHSLLSVHETSIALGRRPELIGGSVGDWFQVFSLRKKDMKVVSDYSILGSSEFVQGLLSEVAFK